VAVSPGSRSLAAFADKMSAKYGGVKISNGPPPVIVSTGSVALDYALRIGGFQLGRIYEILGPKDSGKSTLGIAAIIEYLKRFGERGACYVNMENTFDPRRATAMGLDCSDAAIKSGRWAPLLPQSSEEASDMARDYCMSGAYSIIVVDSIGAMESARVLDKTAEKAADAVGRNAKIITQMTKALSTHARLNDCTVLLINQPRANIGGMGGDISAGPKAMQHSTTAKIEMKALGSREDGDIRSLKMEGDKDPVDVSIRSRMRVTRLKNGIAGRVAEAYINRIATEEYGAPGFDTADEYLTIGVRLKAIAQGGAWYTFPDGERANGKAAAAAYLRTNPDARKAIRAAITFDVPTEILEGDSHAPDPA
jgi:recombination protein RecA